MMMMRFLALAVVVFARDASNHTAQQPHMNIEQPKPKQHGHTSRHYDSHQRHLHISSYCYRTANIAPAVALACRLPLLLSASEPFILLSPPLPPSPIPCWLSFSTHTL
eukprot:scaffold27294_cov72-Cyclotella_meneghiniana.AAC.1